MKYIQFGFIGFAVIVAAWFVFDMVRLYSTAQGSTAQRLLSAGQGSLTIFVNRFIAIITAIAGALASFVTDYLNDPTLAGYIKAMLQPEYVAGFLVVCTMLSIWARKRTLK